MFTFTIYQALGFIIIPSLIYFILICIIENWNSPMNGFQDWLKLHDSLYIKDVLLIENSWGGVDEVWHNDIWFTNEGHSLTTKQLYKEYLMHAPYDGKFSKHFK